MKHGHPTDEDEGTEAAQLSQVFQSLTTAGQFGLAVLASREASELAKADASALVDLTTRRLHEFVAALEPADDEAH